MLTSDRCNQLPSLLAPADWTEGVEWAAKAGPPLCLAQLAGGLAQPGGADPGWIRTGLLLSAAGDVLMLRVQELNSFVGGQAAFLLAHLAYVPALQATGSEVYELPRDPRDLKLLGLVGAAAAVYGGLLHAHVDDELKLPVVLYIAAIVVVGWRAAARTRAAVGQRLRGAALVGAAAFMVSDTLLALLKFHPAF
eukprot:SAG22_NODE_2021_length_3124_cov_4.616860_1_plen_193_part_10